MSFKSFFTPMYQVPFVVTTFMALRKLTQFPVESMSTGGALWFTDLTIVPPWSECYLPLIASVTLLVNMKVSNSFKIRCLFLNV
jgi:membrane protein insertase Oxa1/YidC/SpoIIIJ